MCAWLIHLLFFLSMWGCSSSSKRDRRGTATHERLQTDPPSNVGHRGRPPNTECPQALPPGAQAWRYRDATSPIYRKKSEEHSEPQHSLNLSSTFSTCPPANTEQHCKHWGGDRAGIRTSTPIGPLARRAHTGLGGGFVVGSKCVGRCLWASASSPAMNGPVK